MESPATAAFLKHIVFRDARKWARESGAAELDQDTLDALCERLCRAQWARWSHDGTLQRLRERVAHAFKLDANAVRLARQIAHRRHGPDHANEADYNRAVADRAQLLLLEREAPQLVPLFAELFAAGECTDEPKQAMRTALVDRLGAPRHWRHFVALPAQTLAWARRAPLREYTGALLDLAEFLARLDSPTAPPLDWLQAHLDVCGGVSLLVGTSNDTRVAALRAHLHAWISGAGAGKDQLLIELQIVHDWIDHCDPDTPTVTSRWSWWTRRALGWDRTRRQAALDVPAQHPEPSTQLALGDIELRPLLTPLELYEEARAMAHCLDRWRDRLVKGSAAAWSVRDSRTGRRLATAGISISTDWSVQVRGFANRSVPPDLEIRVRSALGWEPLRLKTVKRERAARADAN